MSIDRVIENGVCVGCGACSFATAGRSKVEWTPIGVYTADLRGLSPAEKERASAVCPFSDDAKNEDHLAAAQFQGTAALHDRRLGYFLPNGLLAGRIVDDEVVQNSSSGGLTTWLLQALLARGLVDSVMHVEPTTSKDQLFKYCISTSVGALADRGKSRYYAVEMSEILRQVANSDHRVVIVGVPCFIKAVRLLQNEDAVLRQRVLYTVGLVCGHMKSSGFAELLGWQLGIQPDRLEKIDFRVKKPEIQSNSYHIKATDRLSGQSNTKESVEFYGNNWGHAFFQLRSCDFCDDIMAETADIAFGDAWLPQYSKVWQGTNVVVCRNDELLAILNEGLMAGELQLESLSPDLVARTQEGNYRHRWDGLSVRLADVQRSKSWAPKKRIAPGSRAVPAWRRRLVRLRVQSELGSHAAFAEAKRIGSIEHFYNVMKPITRRIELQYKLGKFVEGYYLKKVMGRIARILKR